MRWRSLITWVALLLAWIALFLWQLHEYSHERQLARETLRREADAVGNALVGMIRSHRRLGRFFENQIQGALDELVKAEDILAVAIASRDGGPLLSAGKIDLLDVSSPITAGEFWEAGGFRLVAKFQLEPWVGGPGGGWQSRGYGRRWQMDTAADTESPFWSGGQFAAILVLDRTTFDARCRHALIMRFIMIAAGALVLFCVALAWRATVQAAEARGRARLLESEARHLRELAQSAAGLAHETRNPLGLIRGWTQRLARSGSNLPEQEQQAQAVVEECDRLTSRINQFLAFARPCEPNLESVDAAELINELAVLLEPDLEARNLTLKREAAASDGTIRADREMLRQALFNLLQNAVQSSPRGAAVETALRCGQDGRKRIEVADHGTGVPAEAVQSLFTPYYTTRSDGTGLGLAIVRRIAVAHGWEAGYSPRSGGGSIFWLDRIHGA